MSTDDYYLGKYDWTIKYKPYNGFCKLILNDGSTVELKGCGELTSSMIKPYTSILISAVIGKLCTSIEDKTFMGCEELINVIIPDSITSIGQYAFSGCIGLTSIIIPDSVTSIGGSAFYECTSLTSITIPDSVTSIGDSAFEACTNLTSITIPDSVTSIGRYAFYGCISLTNITIPDSVTSIGESAFSFCTSLSNINVDTDNAVYDSRNNCNAIIETQTNTLVHGCKTTIIPDSIISIGSYAFYGCTDLTSITIPDSVTSIGSSVFYECTSLTSITSLATTAPTIQNSTFRSIKTGGTLTVPSGSTGYNAWMSTGDYYLGKYNWTIKEIYMGFCKLTLNDNSTVELEGSGALTSSMTDPYKSKLVNAEIGTLCTSIDSGVFSFYSKLTSVIIGNNVTSIGNNAFGNCRVLANITSLATTAPTITSITFTGIKPSGTLTVPSGSTGYDTWMSTGNYYLGKYLWKKVEQ